MIEQSPHIPHASPEVPELPESAHEADLSAVSFPVVEPTLCGSARAEVSEERRPAPHTAHDILAIRSALRTSFRLFDDLRRNWGPEETLPLAQHTSEVGILLLASGEKKELVMAGFLHDVFEGYIVEDTESIRKVVLSKYGPEVVRLVEAVTEPPKSPEPQNWLERKTAVLEKLEAGDRDTATLSCATKISTIAAGNKFLRMGRPLSDWSAGGAAENVEMFDRHLDLYVRKGVSPVLLEQMELELSHFAAKLGIARAH